MSLSPLLKNETALKSKVLTRLKIIELHATAVCEAIEEGTGISTKAQVDDLLNIVGGQLLKSMTCRLKNKKDGTHHKIKLEFDWDHYRFIVHRDGEKKEVPIRNGMLLPEVQKHREILATTLREICKQFSTTELDWTYTNDDEAVEERTTEGIRKILGTRPLTEAEKEEQASEIVVTGSRATFDVNPFMATSLQRIQSRRH